MAKSSLSIITKNECDEHLQSYIKRNKTKFKFEEIEPVPRSKIISQWVKKTKTTDKTNIDNLYHDVEVYVTNNLISELNQDEKFKVDCSPLKIGGAYEGPRETIPSDFDFLLMADSDILKAEDFHITPVKPDTFNSRNISSEIKEKTYFRLSFNGKEHAKWKDLIKCAGCASPESCTEDHPGRYLYSRAVAAEFAKVIKGCVCNVEKVKQEMPTNCDIPEVHVTQSGPATSIYFSSDIAPDPAIVKVDVTYVIPVPVSMLENLRIKDDLILPDEPLDICFLVAAGDFWRVSFAPHENKLMTALLEDPHKRDCFLAIKELRDRTSPSFPFEKPLLSSYLLKVSFLEENRLHPDTKQWEAPTLEERAVSEFRRIYNDGRNGAQTSFYVEGDPITPGDPAPTFTEARRIAGYFDKCDRYTQRMKKMRYIICGILCVLHVTALSLDIGILVFMNNLCTNISSIVAFGMIMAFFLQSGL